MGEVTNKWRRDRYHSRRAEWIERKGGQCIKCSSTEKLEFDHIDPKLKEFDISKNLVDFLEEQMAEEMTKCQLLCRICHSNKSIEEQGGATKHGSITMYVHHKCRCDLCRETNNIYSRKYKKKYRQKNNGLPRA